MSTFEALKLAYLRSTGKEEPGVLALLAFGSVSGSVGATSVYPMNLVRTRLQASGSPGHPQRYTGIRDVILKTYERDGWRGFYRGLLPTLAKVSLRISAGGVTLLTYTLHKVVPSVSISYLVYEHSKRRCVSFHLRSCRCIENIPFSQVGCLVCIILKYYSPLDSIGLPWSATLWTL